MATVTATVPVRSDWEDGSVIRLRIGGEDVAGLAGSTPAGGNVVNERWAWPPDGVGIGFDLMDIDAHDIDCETAADAVLLSGYVASDPSANLAVGIDVIDGNGDASTVYEIFIPLADPPEGVGRPSVAAGETSGTAVLTFTPSADVV